MTQETAPRTWRARKNERQGNRLEARLRPLHDPSGIDTERAEHFVQALGLPMTRYVLVNKADERGVVRAFRRTSTKPPRSLEAHGQHFAELNMAVVYRQPDKTKATERTLVHELAHGRPPYAPSMGRTALNYLPFGPRPPFSGFISGRRGWCSEEAFAVMIEGGYAQLLQRNTDLQPTTMLPAKYTREEGHPYPYAGMALEVLCTRTPELLDLLIASRHDSSRMAKVAEAYNDIRPGLFDIMQDVRTEDNFWGIESHFWGGLHVALSAAGYTMDDIPTIHEQGVVASYMQTRMEEYEVQTGYRFVPDEAAV